MTLKPQLRLLFLGLAVLALLFLSGCGPDPEPVEDPADPEEEEVREPIVEEPEEEEPVDEAPETAPTYFWPWLSHGHLILSTGEVIIGPDLLESESGFIAEFPPGHSYSGRLVWPAVESDLFALEWVSLSFTVDFYDQYELQFDLDFDFDIVDLRPEPGEEGIQQFELELVDEQKGFRVEIDRIILGKEQEGNFIAGPFDFVALDIVISALEMPQ